MARVEHVLDVDMFEEAHPLQRRACLPQLFISAIIIAYILMSLLLFPKFYLTSDENIYLRDAYYILKGNIFEKQFLQNNKEGFNFYYPLGNAALLAPWLKMGFKSVFYANQLLFILSAILFSIILWRLKIPIYYSALFILNPSMVLYSRTLLSEIPSCFLLILGTLFYIIGERRLIFKFASFLVFGLSCLIRYTNFLYLFSFGCLYIYYKAKERRFLHILLISGATVGMGIVLLQNRLRVFCRSVQFTQRD